MLSYKPDKDIDGTIAYEENVESDIVNLAKDVRSLITLLTLKERGIRRNLKIRRNEAWNDYYSYLCKS